MTNHLPASCVHPHASGPESKDKTISRAPHTPLVAPLLCLILATGCASAKPKYSFYQGRSDARDFFSRFDHDREAIDEDSKSKDAYLLGIINETIQWIKKGAKRRS